MACRIVFFHAISGPDLGRVQSRNIFRERVVTVLEAPAACRKNLRSVENGITRLFSNWKSTCGCLLGMREKWVTVSCHGEHHHTDQQGESEISQVMHALTALIPFMFTIPPHV